ncbi:MAG TPA: glycoside hydrolase family 2 protein [Candidatus Marinimicrobia bacterium]|nr:glycoside hydrolase family 2 protein [Candidatus Neomarinimicrobiota bacterium]
MKKATIDVRLTSLMKHLPLILLVAALSFQLGCNNAENLPTEITLTEGWLFRESNSSDWFPATVPGTVHTDLLNNNLINDPFLGNNEEDLQWIEDKNWEYKTIFFVDRELMGNDVIELEFDGLDTYADVYLNEQPILKADNMFRAWRVACKKILREGENELRIHFHSPVRVGQRKLETSPYLIPTSNEPKPVGYQTSVHTRKAQYHYGWDWGPRLVTSGIWRPIVLSGWSSVKIRSVFYQLNKLTEANAHYSAHLEIEAAKEMQIDAHIALNSKIAGEVTKQTKLNKGMNFLSVDFIIDNPKLWWPNGLGKQNLYQITTEVLSKGEILDSKEERIGVKTLELIREPDDVGTSFYFRINGEPVFMKGANYIPPDFFNPRATKSYEDLISAAKHAHMNMLRVWGGGVYENDDFYRLCDENGILIWQDFMFACCMVPGNKDHLENIRLEAEHNIKRLRNHPSVALWCGNNENLTGWREWGWKKQYNHSDNDSVAIWETYEELFYNILPTAVETFDPGKPYWPSSPSGKKNELQNRSSGDQHEWGVWFGQMPLSHYESNAGRFISEYGLQALPSLETVKQFDPQHWNNGLSSPVLTARQRSKMPWIEPGFDGYDMIEHYISLEYKPAKDFESFIYLSQLAQADALKRAAEAHRRNKPTTMGSLYWQLADCWPTVSWSTIDFFGRRKAGYFAIERAYREVIISASDHGDSIEVSVISERLNNFQGEAIIRLRNTEKGIYLADSIQVVTDNDQPKIIAMYDKIDLLSEVTAEGAILQMILLEKGAVIHQNYHLFVKSKSLILTEPKIEIQTTFQNELIHLQLQSDVFVKSVELSSIDIEGFFSDNFFNLFPGEPVKVQFQPKKSGGKKPPHFQIRSLFDTLDK